MKKTGWIADAGPPVSRKGHGGEPKRIGVVVNVAEGSA